MPALQSFNSSIILIRLWAAIEAPLSKAARNSTSERPNPTSGHQPNRPQSGRNNAAAIIPRMEMAASMRARFESLLGDIDSALSMRSNMVSENQESGQWVIKGTYILSRFPDPRSPIPDSLITVCVEFHKNTRYRR